MSKISLSTKIIACFSIILIVAVASSVISIISAQASLARIGSVANVNVPLSTLTTQSMDELTSMVLSVRTYTTTGAQSDYDAGQLHYANTLEALKAIHPFTDGRETARADNERKILALLETNTEAYFETTRRTKLIIEELGTLSATIQENSVELNTELMNWVRDNVGMHRLNDAELRPVAAKIAVLLTDILMSNELAIGTVELAIAQRDASVASMLTPIIEQMAAEFNELEQIVASPAGRNLHTKSKGFFDACMVASERALALLSELDELNKQRLPLADSLTNGVSDMAKIVFESTEEGANTLHSNLINSTYMSIAFTIAMIIVGLLAILYVSRGIIKKLQDFVLIMANFTSGDGDLTKRIPITSEDEIGQLGMHVNSFVESIQGIIGQVAASSNNVASGNNELAATMEELSTTFNSQSQQVSDVANNMGVMNEGSQGIVSTVQRGRSTMDEA
ncbi:MAG: methyl-accepting chemotaxis protein, partial [Deferribacteraceae bacterium]|nr:methyl-accepting chemotaxis protein [Deferribacteraceae bacterium]